MQRRKKPVSLAMTISIMTVLCFIFSGITFAIGTTWRASEYNSNLATKPYVDKGLEETKRFAVEQDKLVTKDAHDWSDANRQAMALRNEQLNSVLNAKLENYGAKQEMILNSLGRLEDAIAQRYKRP